MKKKKEKTDNFLLPITIYPCHKKIQIELNKENNYIIGGHIYNIPVKNNYKIYRLTSKNKNKKHSNIMIKCIDDNRKKQIQFMLVDNESIYIDETPNHVARTFATMIIEPFVSLEVQKKIVERGNKILNEHREKYHSLFLTNYRESKDIARKRISFDLAYRIIEHVLDEIH